MKRFLLLVSFALAKFVHAADDPALEFSRGEKQVFLSKDHPKALGLDLIVEYPKSWRAEEENLPSVVQKFVAKDGSSLASSMISVKNLPFPPGMVLTDADMARLLSDVSLRKLIPSEAQALKMNRTKIAKQPAGCVEFISIHEVGKIRIKMFIQNYIVYYGKWIINIQYQVGLEDGPNADQKIEAGRKNFQHLFDLMTNGIIIRTQGQSN